MNNFNLKINMLRKVYRYACNFDRCTCYCVRIIKRIMVGRAYLHKYSKRAQNLTVIVTVFGENKTV